MLLPQDNSDTVNLSVPQVVLLSLQAFFNLDHVLDDTAASNSFARACFTTSTPTGRQIVHFFDLLGQLISSNGNT